MLFLSISFLLHAQTTEKLPHADFYGIYKNTVCDLDCHWTVNEGGTGEWVLSFSDGSKETTRFSWGAMIDKDGNYQEASTASGSKRGYVLKITLDHLSTKVKQTMSKTGLEGLLVIYFINNDFNLNGKLMLQNMQKLNDFNFKDGNYTPPSSSAKAPQGNTQQVSGFTNNSPQSYATSAAPATASVPTKTNDKYAANGGVSLQDQNAFNTSTNYNYSTASRPSNSTTNSNNYSELNEVYQISSDILQSAGIDMGLTNSFVGGMNLGGGSSAGSAAAITNSITSIAGAADVTSAISGGFGLAGSLLSIFDSSPSPEEQARLERERQKKLEEERRKTARQNMFKAYPAGELPNSSANRKDEMLYYFAYTYSEAELKRDYPNAVLSNVFSVGKYPDGTWILKDKINAKIREAFRVTGIPVVICGPFYSAGEAQNVYYAFKNNLQRTQMQEKSVSVPNFGSLKASTNTTNTTSAKPQLDFWGNPIK